MKNIKYKGYVIAESGDNYMVKTAQGVYLFSEVAANVQTAKKWIDAFLIEKNNKKQ